MSSPARSSSTEVPRRSRSSSSTHQRSSSVPRFTADEFFAWNTDNFDQFFDLTRELLHPHRTTTLKPMIGSKDYTARLLKHFHEKARQRNSADRVKRDIELLGECFSRYERRSMRLKDLPSHCQEVLLFYDIYLRQPHNPAKFSVMLRDIGPIFPNAVCEYVQRFGLRMSQIRPVDVVPGCPRFVCDHNFVFLIPRQAKYDCWFELHLRFRTLLHMTRIKYFHTQQSEAVIREVCEKERQLGHLSDNNRIFYLERLIKISRLTQGDLSKLFQATGQLQEVNARPKKHVTFQIDNSEKSSGRGERCRSAERHANGKMSPLLPTPTTTTTTTTTPRTVVDDAFARNFFAWSTQFNLTGPFFTKPQRASTKEQGKPRQVTLVPEHVNLYSVARVFYEKSLRRTARQLSRTLSLLISYFVEHGSFLTAASVGQLAEHTDDMIAVIELYEMKNHDEVNTRNDHPATLTLTRLARLFPWLVCQYVQKHYGSTEDEFATPAYMAHPSFASLIPRSHTHDEQFEQHVQYHFEQYHVPPGHQLVRRDMAARIRHTLYLNDTQRTHLLERLDRFELA